ncbi:MAG: TIGR00266 family protein [Anaerolineae bacterium]|mgnify:CR=1 FL=1|nr:TIGR00266 family protein [Anaerolineae bacterium]MDX9829955.1 TIGR00266 family protein [Anaerolineae bacterium]
MRCQECGAENEPNARFCTSCGATLRAAAVPAGDPNLQPLDTEVEHVQREYEGSRGRISYRIDGTTLQVVTIELEPGEVIYSESGGMSWMTGNVEMKTHSGGGLGKMFKRALSGESLFITDFFVNNNRGTVAFASEFPGKIIPFDLRPGESIIVQKDAFMCAEKSVEMDMAFRKRLGTGMFGGEGFIMQRISGPGLAFIEVDGEVVEYELQAGQQLKVDTGHLAAMEATVDFDVTMVKGFRNILLGGEGLFLASVRGPGKVWLQTMPMSKLAQKVAQFMPQAGGKGSSGGLNIDVGNLLGGG